MYRQPTNIIMNGTDVQQNFYLQINDTLPVQKRCIIFRFLCKPVVWLQIRFTDRSSPTKFDKKYT